MNPFIRKLVKSQAEKDRLILEAAREWDELGEQSYMVAASEEDYLARVADGIEVEREPFVPGRPLTAAEADEIDSSLLFQKIYDGRIDNHRTGIPALDDLADAKKRADIEKLLGPGRRAQNALDGMIEKAVTEAFAKLTKRAGTRSEVVHGHSIPVRQPPERETIVTRLADRAEEENAASLLSKWLRGYVAGDEQAMRRVARELAVEGA